MGKAIKKINGIKHYYIANYPPGEPVVMSLVDPDRLKYGIWVPYNELPKYGLYAQDLDDIAGDWYTPFLVIGLIILCLICFIIAFKPQPA